MYGRGERQWSRVDEKAAQLRDELVAATGQVLPRGADGATYMGVGEFNQTARHLDVAPRVGNNTV